MASPSAEQDDFIENDDLFGDDDEEQSERGGQISEQEDDSGDDEDRIDHARDTMEGLEQEDMTEDREARILDASVPRHPIPQSTDGELHILRIPEFLGVAPTPFDSSSFTVPDADHHAKAKSANFSANATATSTIRFRKNVETGKLESNTILSRWSDGSMTLSVGENIYELTGKPLTSSAKDAKGYQDHLDSHQYAATPYMASQLLHMVGHLTNQFEVRPNKEIEDVALERLQKSLEAATRARHKGDAKDGIIISMTQDPELQRKQAEQAEKERMKLQRRRENAAAKADQQSGRLRGVPGGGLSLDDLEGRQRYGGPKKPRNPPSGQKRSRRRPEYDSDDDLPRGRGREDEYDLEDDFLVASDEEEEEVEDGDESEEEIDEESEKEESPRLKKQKTSHQDVSAPANVGSDLDAEGEDEETVPTPSEPGAGADAAHGRGRKRNIIEDDDDE